MPPPRDPFWKQSPAKSISISKYEISIPVPLYDINMHIHTGKSLVGLGRRSLYDIDICQEGCIREY